MYAVGKRAVFEYRLWLYLWSCWIFWYAEGYRMEEAAGLGSQLLEEPAEGPTCPGDHFVYLQTPSGHSAAPLPVPTRAHMRAKKHSCRKLRPLLLSHRAALWGRKAHTLSWQVTQMRAFPKAAGSWMDTSSPLPFYTRSHRATIP